MAPVDAKPEKESSSSNPISSSCGTVVRKDGDDGGGGDFDDECSGGSSLLSLAAFFKIVLLPPLPLRLVRGARLQPKPSSRSKSSASSASMIVANASPPYHRAKCPPAARACQPGLVLHTVALASTKQNAAAAARRPWDRVLLALGLDLPRRCCFSRRLSSTPPPPPADAAAACCCCCYLCPAARPRRPRCTAFVSWTLLAPLRCDS